MNLHPFSTPSLPAPGIQKRRRAIAGFSLVEITMAIGIMAFGLVAVVSLMPVGLESFRKSQTRTVAQEIADRWSAEIKQTNFSDLGTVFTQTNANGSKGQSFSHDDQGNIVKWGDARTTYYSKAFADWGTGATAGRLYKGPLADNPDILIIEIMVAQYPVAGQTPWGLKDSKGNYRTETDIDTFHSYVVVGNGINTASIAK